MSNYPTEAVGEGVLFAAYGAGNHTPVFECLLCVGQRFPQVLSGCFSLGWVGWLLDVGQRREISSQFELGPLPQVGLWVLWQVKSPLDGVYFLF